MNKFKESFEMMLGWLVSWAAKNHTKIRAISRTKFAQSPREERGPTLRL